MATLYFNAATDNNWNMLTNWWQDSAFSIPATSFPTTGDTVYIEGDVGTGPSAAVTLAALYIAQINSANLADAGSGIAVSGDLTVGKSNYLSGNLSVNLTVDGAAYFYGSSENLATLTVTLASFSQDSLNYEPGVISGNAVFDDSSYNFYGTITGNATFHDQAYNYGGTVGGDATFNDVSVNNGTVSGNATFNNHTTNYGTVSANATFNLVRVNSPPLAAFFS